MLKRIIYIVGSAVIGIIAMLTVTFSLIAADVINPEGERLVISSESATAEYNGEALRCENFKLESGVLDEGHLISADFTGERTAAGKSDNLFTVKVLDGGGNDVSSRYTIELRYGTLEVTQRVLAITAGSAEKQFDGKPLKASSFEISSGSLATGHTVSAEYTGEQTLAGVGKSSLVAKVLDKNGVDVTSSYVISVTEGSLTVSKRSLLLRSKSEEVFYDGSYHVTKDIVVSEGELPAGHVLNATFTEGLKNVGSVDNRFSVTVTDLQGNDLLANYDVRYVFGKITVLPKTLTLSTKDASKTYDGSPLICHDYERVSGELAEGETLSVDYMGQRTEAGVSANTASFTVSDAQGNKTTGNYDITVVHGSLTVIKHGLGFTSPSASKIYDGEELSAKGVTLAVGTLPEGYTYEYGSSAGITNAGEILNDFTVIIKNPAGDVVTDSFEINKICGKLTVLPRELVISTLGASQYYSGEKLECKSYIVENESALLGGHEIEAEFASYAYSIDVGSVVNELSSVKVMAGEEDVSHNYDIKCVYGDLVTIPITIRIRTSSASKDYDGTPLTSDAWEIVSFTKPLDGHTVNVAISGSQLAVGSSKNTVAEVLIKAGDVDITKNYEIILQLGELVVNGASAGSGSSGGSVAGLDASGSMSGSKPLGEVMLEIYSEVDAAQLLRYKSFGNFTGQGWGSAFSYGSTLGGKYSMGYLSSVAMKNSGLESNKIIIKNRVSDQYFLPYYADTDELDYAIQSDDVVNNVMGSNQYSLYFFDYTGDGKELSGKLGEYSDEELLYREFVYGKYLYIDGETSAYLQTIIDKNNLSSADEDIIYKIRNYIISAAEYDMNYDVEMDDAENVVLAFLDEYKTGVCRHFASAGVLLYRAVGIPARYTVGFSSKTEVGSWSEVTDEDAHAWVEVYIDGVGWIAVDVTPSVDMGADSGESTEDYKSNTYTVYPEPVYMKYDGATTLYPINEVRGINKLTELGYTYEVSVSGSRKAPGVSNSVIEEFALYDKSGKDVTEEFDIVFAAGKIQVYIAEITVTSGSATEIYSGATLVCDETSVEGALLSGNSFSVLKTLGSQTEVGKSTNGISVRISDAGGADVTDYYKINKVLGILEVTPREITVVADSASKTYDGMPLIDSEYTVIGELALGDTVTVSVTGSQTEIGRRENRVESVTVSDALGNDVTHNYTVICKSGVLTVLPE